MQGSAGNAAVAALLQRQPKTGTPPVKTGTPPGGTDTAGLAAELEPVWNGLLGFSKTAMPELRRVAQYTRWHLERYDKAWASFSKQLSAAQRAAAEREKWNDAVKGILVGTGIGLAAGTLYSATKLLGKVLYEAVGETAELGVGSQIDTATGVDFAPPEATADKEARKHLDSLFQGAMGVAGIQAAALAYSPRRDQIRDGADKRPSLTKGEWKPITAAHVRTEIGELKRGLGGAEAAFASFVRTMDSPVMRRSETLLEQDLWVTWMSKRPENANQILGDEDLAKYLQNIGVLGRIAGQGQGLTGQVHDLAQAELKRMGTVGRMGVVVVPPRRPGHVRGWDRGVIKLRHDAYAAAGRPDPDPKAAEEHRLITWAQGAYLRPGEVVMVTGTTNAAVGVERMGREVGVTDQERASAMQFAGIEPATYVPEAADQIMPVVAGGVAYDPELKGRVKLAATHDGVLVSDVDGARLVLICPMTDPWLADARTRRARSGAARAVVVKLDPGGIPAFDYRDGQVTLTTNSGSSGLAAEIRTTRAEVVKAPAR